MKNSSRFAVLLVSITVVSAMMLMVVKTDSASAPWKDVGKFPRNPGLFKPQKKPDGSFYFSGIKWIVRDNPNRKGGPGPNYFSASTDNVWLDREGQLHLRITYRYGKWYCAEIYTEQSLDYGRYTFFVSSRVDLIDINVVVGLFTWLSDGNEIDIEFARWGYPTAPNAQFVVQPWDNPGNTKEFRMNLDSAESTHSFNWQSDHIDFMSVQGHYYEPPSQDYVIQQWQYTGGDIPPQSSEKVHLNFWLREGLAPTDGQEAEVVIKRFVYTPGVNVLNDDDVGEGRDSGINYSPLATDLDDDLLTYLKRYETRSVNERVVFKTTITCDKSVVTDSREQLVQ